MFWFDQLVEERIRAAQAKGEFDALPGEGKPLALDDDSLIPPEMRMAVRILKNAGYVPPELQALSQINQLEAVIRCAEGEAAREACRRLEYLLWKLDAAGLAHTSQAVLQRYHALLAERLGVGAGK